MKKIITIIAAMTLAALTTVALTSCAQKDSSSSWSVSDAWVRVTAPKQTNSAAYMKITVSEDDVLTNVSVTSSIAARAELHETTKPMDTMSMETNPTEMHNMVGMRQVSSIKVPAAGGIRLEPGGFHIMIMDLVKPIKLDELVPLTLTFRKAGKVKVEASASEN